MSVADRLAATRAAAHPGCRLCGTAPAGLPRLEFARAGDGVRAGFACEAPATGYPGLVHGGILAAILDAALTNALFAQGVAALTARLTLRYRRPVRLGLPAEVVARCTRVRRGAWEVAGTISQEGRMCVEAAAVFLPLPAVGGA